MPKEPTTAISLRPKKAVKKRLRFPLAAQERVAKDTESEVPRNELVEILDANAAVDERCRALATLLSQPCTNGKPMTLFVAASKVGFSQIELIDLIRKHRLGLGVLRMTRHLPQMMEDTAKDALSEDLKCLDCDGSGTLTKGKGDAAVEITCRGCRGTGVVRQKGDIENRKLMFEATGIIKRGAFMNQNITLGGAPVESFEALVGRAGDIIEARAEPVLTLPKGDS